MKYLLHDVVFFSLEDMRRFKSMIKRKNLKNVIFYSYIRVNKNVLELLLGRKKRNFSFILYISV